MTSRATALRLGQELRVDPTPAGPPGGAPEGDPTVAFEVVHEDTEVIVVDKPAGLVVHPAAGHPGGTLVNGLVARYPELARLPEETGADSTRPGIVHRLDRGTSGLMVVARTPGAFISLVDQLRERQVTRRYRALVAGRVDAESGLIDAPIGRSVDHAHPHGRLAAGQDGPHPLPGGGPVQPPGRGHLARRAVGHRPDPSDPGPSLGHRPPGRGGRGLPARAATSRGRAPPAVPARRRAVLRTPRRAGTRCRWTSDLPDELRLQLEALEP